MVQTRLIGSLVLCMILTGLFIAYGAELGQQETAPYGSEAVVTAPGDIVGERVSLTGTVVSTEPVTISVDHDDVETELVLENAPETTSGDVLSVVGKFTSVQTLSVDPASTVVRAPWEMQYMYAVSIIAVIGLVLRAVNHWRIRCGSLAFEPRERTLYAQYRGSDDG